MTLQEFIDMLPGLVCFLGFLTLSFMVWWLPVFIAIVRGHPNLGAIAIVDILLGWTCVGWVIALAWSLTAVDRPAPRVGYPPQYRIEFGGNPPR